MSGHSRFSGTKTDCSRRSAAVLPVTGISKTSEATVHVHMLTDIDKGSGAFVKVAPDDAVIHVAVPYGAAI